VASKLTAAQVVQIRRATRNGTHSCLELALRYRVSSSAIYYAAIGVTWQDVVERPAVLGQVRIARRASTGGKQHREQTTTWISRVALRYLTARKTSRREAVGRVLDRVLQEHRRLTTEVARG
jgi:hypothetical protein